MGSDRDLCDRRGCVETPTMRIVKESVRLHDPPVDFYICDEHTDDTLKEFDEYGATIVETVPLAEVA